MIPDADPLVVLVQDDVAIGLGDVFTPAEGFTEDAGFVTPPFFDADDVLRSRRLAAVAWEYHGVHTGEFQGIPPTGRAVVIHGVTVIEGRDGDRPLLRRYIDWSEVMAQLGMTWTGRPTLDEPFPGRGRGGG